MDLMRRFIGLVFASALAFASGAFYPYATPLLLASGSLSRPFLITTGYVSDTEAASSPDAVTWTTSSLPSLSAWGSSNPTYSVGLWSGTNFLVAAYNTSVGAISPNGQSWTTVTLPAAGTWSPPAAIGATIVLPARNTSGQVALSTNAGASWSLTATSSTTAVWAGAASNGSIFCLVSSNSTVAASSPNGSTWTARSLPASPAWNAVGWNGTLFYVSAAGSTTAATSPDCVTWTARTAPASTGQVYAANTLFFYETGGTGYYTSPDGVTWTARTAPASISGVIWNGAQYLGMGAGHAMTSPDGVTWTTRTLPSSTRTWSYAF